MPKSTIYPDTALGQADNGC